MKINKFVSLFTLASMFLNFSSQVKAEPVPEENRNIISGKHASDKKLLISANASPKDETDGDEKEEIEGNPAQKAKIGGRNVNAFTRKGKAGIGGYFDTEYFFPQNKNSFFDQHRLVLQASSLLHERLFFNTEIEYEHGGLIGAGTNDGELKIEQAWLDFQLLDWLILRGGALLIPVGRLNILHDSDLRDTTARPLFNTVIVPTTWMEPGFGFYGTVYPNDDLELNYELYMTQGLIDKVEDGSGLRKARPSLSKDNNSGKALTARFGLSPFIGLDLGLSGYYSTFDEKNQKNLGLVAADFNYSIGPFELLGEGGFTAFSPADQKDAAGKVVSTLTGPMWGYYVEGHYNFFPEFMRFSFLGNDFDKPSFTLFSRIDQVDTDVTKLNANDRTQLTFGLNYRPITNVVFKFEYQVNIENEAVLKGDSTKEIANNQFIVSLAAGF